MPKISKSSSSSSTIITKPRSKPVRDYSFTLRRAPRIRIVNKALREAGLNKFRITDECQRQFHNGADAFTIDVLRTCEDLIDGSTIKLRHIKKALKLSTKVYHPEVYEQFLDLLNKGTELKERRTPKEKSTEVEAVSS